MTQGRPRPRNTLTELEPVMFPTAESAYWDCLAAVMLAKVSGSDVPIATKVIAVTEFYKPMTHPSIVATSPTMAVIIPMKVKAMKNAGTPFPIYAGGTKAKRTFQNMLAKCDNPSYRVT